jgi:phosphoribosylformimino-5-aminoimidazole carboxamide ribotide isomerase
VLVIPALDIRGGLVVRLLQGDFAREKAYASDPMPLARAYAEEGARRLHVVDLDAARGTGDNRRLVEGMAAELGIELQVAGGVRSNDDVERWLDAGAGAVVMGTTAVREPEVLGEIAARHRGRVLAALDSRAGRPAVTGWSEVARVTVPELLERWEALPLAGVILTSIDRDGTLAGPDLAGLGVARAATRHHLTYSGGIGRLADLGSVAAAGADAVILGKSLLEGHFTLPAALASC